MTSRKPWQYEVTARFYDIDRAGIVFFATLYKYCHATFETLLQAMLGPDLEQSFAAGAWPMPLVHSEADYAHPVRLGDRIVVSLAVTRLGRTSITFVYDLTGSDGVHRAKITLVHAFVEPGHFRSAPVTPEIQAGLRRLELID